MKEKVPLSDRLTVGFIACPALTEEVGVGRARGRFVHMRAKDWVKNPRTGLLEPDYRFTHGALDLNSVEVLSDETTENLITNAGRIFLHKQIYDASGLSANGLNYIALSNDLVTETAASTVLSNEIAANGLSRAQGTVTLPVGSNNQTTVQKFFTATGTQSAQKAALFSASSAGTMNHVLGFAQRNLINGDALQVTFTITLG